MEGDDLVADRRAAAVRPPGVRLPSLERKVELVRRALRECRFDTFGAIVTARRGRLHEVCPDLAAYAASPDNPRELRREARAAVAKLQASVPGADTQ